MQNKVCVITGGAGSIGAASDTGGRRDASARTGARSDTRRRRDESAAAPTDTAPADTGRRSACTSSTCGGATVSTSGYLVGRRSFRVRTTTLDVQANP
jgi:hypothetical protein